MRVGGLTVILIATGCVSQSEPTNTSRCALRISHRGTFVDGERMSRVDAVISQCKKTDGALVVVEDDVPCFDWEPTCSALRQAGVPIAMRGPVGDFEQPIVAGSGKPPPEEPLVRCSASCN